MKAHNNAQSSGKIPKDKIWEFRECFSWFDKDGDQQIQGVDLPVAVRAMGQYWQLEELIELAKEFPPSRNVTLPQFLSICSRKYGVVPDYTSIEKAFAVFDRNRDGQVFLDDIRHALLNVGEKLTREEFDELCRVSGIRLTGPTQTISKKEFLRLFTKM